MKNRNLAYLYAGLTILFWGTAASAFKFTLGYFSFIRLLVWSSFFSTTILFIILLLSGKFSALKKLTRKEVAPSVYLGLINPFFYYFILFRAYELLPAQVAQPLNFIWPLVLVLLSVPFLNEKLSLRSIICLLISFIGVALISSQGNPLGFEIQSPLGVALALLSSIIWALYWILNLKYSRIDVVVRLFLNFIFATAYALCVTLFLPDFWDINLYGILGSIYVGFFEMGITFVLWLKALSLAESKAKLNNVMYLVPFISLLFIRFFVGETIYWTTITGLCVIVGSILFQQFSNNHKKVEKS